MRTIGAVLQRRAVLSKIEWRRCTCHREEKQTIRPTAGHHCGVVDEAGVESHLEGSVQVEARPTDDGDVAHRVRYWTTCFTHSRPYSVRARFTPF